MKRRFAICIIFVIVVLAWFSADRAAVSARADSEFAMVVGDNAPLYSDASCLNVKFYVPKSYFVKVVSVGADYTRVIYMDDSSDYPSREGYLKNADLDFSVETPTSPYPNVVLTAITDEVLFGGTDKSQPKTVVTAGSEAVLYGEMPFGGERLLYVYYAGFIGYVRESAFAPFTVPLHPSYVESQKPQTTAPESAEISGVEDKNDGEEKFPLAAIIFAVVVVFALLILFFVLKPDKAGGGKSYFGDRDD